MKKLMFILAIASAIVAQAASVDWSIPAKGFNDQAESGDFTKTVYLLQVNTTEGSNYQNLIAALSGGTLEGGIAGFDASDWSAIVGSATSYTGTRMSKSYGKTTGTATVSSVGEASYRYLVFDGEYYMLSGAQTGVSYTSSPDDGDPVGFQASDAGSWTKYVPDSGGGGAPEPTSGLLLLVGGSLLALRRRRA